MTRLRAWLTRWLVRDIYPVVDCGEIVDVATSLQGAELKRLKHAQDLALMAGGSDEFNGRVERMVYNRQRIEHFVVGVGG